MHAPNQSMDGGSRFEVSAGVLTAEEQCLVDLFDLADLGRGSYERASEFFVATRGHAAPDDLETLIVVDDLAGDGAPSSWTFPSGADVVTTVSVSFNSNSDSRLGMHNIDFVRTEQGVKAYERCVFIENDRLTPKHIRVLDEVQLAALAADAKKIAQIKIDIDTERLQLGSLVEAAGPDGLRRFHVGDILAVILGGQQSPRGLDGIVDLIKYMTDDVPFSTQIGRFMQECGPSLRAQFDAVLGAFYTPPEGAWQDTPSVYRWLGSVIQTLGESFFTVVPLTEAQHARIDIVTELELDYGSEVMKKVFNAEVEAGEEER